VPEQHIPAADPAGFAGVLRADGGAHAAFRRFDSDCPTLYGWDSRCCIADREPDSAELRLELYNHHNRQRWQAGFVFRSAQGPRSIEMLRFCNTGPLFQSEHRTMKYAERSGDFLESSQESYSRRVDLMESHNPTRQW